MSIAMAGTDGASLFFGADSKIHLTRPADDEVVTAVAPKVTTYAVRDGILVVAHTGMWVTDTTDGAFLDVLRRWTGTTEAVAKFAGELAGGIAQLLTQQAAAEGAALGALPVPSEFLVGWSPPARHAELWLAASQHLEAVQPGVLLATGGRGNPTFTKQYRRYDAHVDAAFLRTKVYDVLTNLLAPLTTSRSRSSRSQEQHRKRYGGRTTGQTASRSTPRSRGGTSVRRCPVVDG